MKLNFQVSPEYNGNLMVLHAEETAATVLITSARRHVVPGQKLHAAAQ
jgi:hypothetical protein